MIDLTDIPFQTMEPMMPDSGVVQKSQLGGASFKLNRIGGGLTVTAQLPPMRMEPDGRRLVARLQLAKRQGLQIAYLQVAFNIGSPGDPTVDGAVVGGMTLPITGAQPHYEIAQGQALNVTKASRPYLYFAAEAVALDEAGAGEVPLTTPLRTQLVGGEAVELKRPVIEGWLTSDVNWPIEMDSTTGLSITVEERA